MDDNARATTIQMGAAADGTLTYLVDAPPEALPPVRQRDLAAAWDAARSAATHEDWGPARLFRFRRGDGSATDLALADPDACCWAHAVDATIGTSTSYGLSLCLRLLGLVDLLAQARWADALFTVRRDGAEIHPALLHAAATTALTPDARLDPERVRALVARASMLSSSATAPRLSSGAPA
ncbi:hypothetical protein [Limobrevibacterium gyesilva]|uniref:Uncharacterized protein n=1 Tax=Limobrevibacterium gyesilva TaxID=2991712 RepID=A0AA42CFL7_9PROT|nr:hypothetical protein [Limobrevibacterium gyesilva]MCW3475036.1 hypothetical protein [Limobrevibacterium gyesilva]